MPGQKTNSLVIGGKNSFVSTGVQNSSYVLSLSLIAKSPT